MDDSLLQQLRQCQDELLALQNALDASETGYWSWDEGQKMKCDRVMLALFAIDSDQCPETLEDFAALVDDSTQAALAGAFDDARERNHPIDLQVTAEKTGKRLRISGRAFLSPGKSGISFSGLCRLDETEAAEKATPESRSELANFASVASHDLREPLRMVSSYLKLLQERSPDALDSRARRYIGYACEGADRMRRLIEDLLGYARMENERIDPVPLALEDILSETISNLSAAIKETSAEVTVDIDQAPIVLGDSIKLVRLFQNLISNAIKFQGEGEIPRVHISFEDGDTAGSAGMWIVSVRDQGIGIEEDHHELLFSLFQRLNTRDEFEGSGIGLAVCKKVAERHGGTISFTSVKGEGSTFRVSLPKAGVDALAKKI